MVDMLIIPDSHCDPEESNDRYTWAGNLIVDRKPDIINNLGDMFDLSSLSSFDRGKRSAEGRRYEQEVSWGIDAQEKLFSPINSYNKSRKFKYKPTWNFFLGNHENRAYRAGEDFPAYYGYIDPIEQFKLLEFGWTVHKFKDVVDISGIYFSHFFTAGRMDRPIGGQNQARTILNKTKVSSVSGHSHIRDIAWETAVDGRELFALVAGRYFEKEVSYVTKREQANWWTGLTLLKGVQPNGVVRDIEFISMQTIKDKYK